MLNNINKTKNIVVPFAPHNDSVQVQAAGFVVWSGWLLVYPSVTGTDSLLKQMYNNFNLISVPTSSIK
ncbi:hypothetical protein Q7W17_01155 [Streptococcus suis]|uniref:hypothetical protein n=1 Tax=Streptococcus TaxID=1301 RepID=UPI000C18ED75|nr:hypothetical protein [Streptococcus suis]MDW8680732.1 hypothetical protein [Streptococcus suis]HEM3701545.1 hypothetical protein [Streptococcus suis]